MTTTANMKMPIPSMDDSISIDIPNIANAITSIDTEFAQRMVNVKWYGAKGDGITDDTNAIQTAINSGNVVFFPQGTYILNPSGAGGSALSITNTSTRMLLGMNKETTILQLANTTKDLLSITVDGCIIEGLTLDVQTHQCQTTASIVANKTKIRKCNILGSKNVFSIFFAGPSGATQSAPLYNTDNEISDCYVSDQYDGDGLSFSFQQRGLIKNVHEVGSRLALYVGKDVTVENFTFDPNPNLTNVEGIYVTAPYDDLTIENFKTSGMGGRFGYDNSYPMQNIIVDKLVMTAQNKNEFTQVVGAQKILFRDLITEGSNSVVISPQANISDIKFEGGIINQISFQQITTVSVTKVTCDDVTFPNFTAQQGQNGSTFVNFNNAPCEVQVNGGTFEGAGLQYQMLNGNGKLTINKLQGFNPQGFFSPGYNPPVSGTVYQNLSGSDMTIYLPVYATTAGTAGNVAINLGKSNSGLTLINYQYVSGSINSNEGQIIELRVPAWWYFEFVGTNVTFSNATYFVD